MSQPSGTDSAVQIELVGEASPELVAGFRDMRDRLGRASADYAPTAEDIQEIIAAPGTTLMAARTDGGDVVGSVTVAVYRLPSGLRAWIEDLVVARGEVGKGIGDALIRRALEVVDDAGATSVEILVDPTQASARNLFQRIGFGPYEKTPYWMRRPA